MRQLSKIVIGKNFNGNLNEIKAENKTNLVVKVDDTVKDGYKVVPNDYQYINYRPFQLVPIVEDVVKGNVNGRMSAQLLWDLFKKDPEASNKRETIEWWVKNLTVGQILTKPGGLCYYSKENRLLVLNESRENWQSNRAGERDRMYIIGSCCEEQGIVYRYLPKAAPDESTVLILALPDPKQVVAAFKAQKEQPDKPTLEQTVQAITDKVVDEGVLPIVQPEKPKEIVAPTVRRGIVRKNRKEIDISKLEDMVDDEG